MIDRRLLFVGNFFSADTHRTYCEDMTERLEGRGWRLARTSVHRGRALRLADMVHATWRRRRDYALAHVDVYSGLSFAWAEAVGLELGVLGKPFVLTLRGGNLPVFARRWPRRTRRLFEAAAVVTAPTRYLAEAMAPYGPPIVVVPNALELGHYPFSLREAPAPRLVWVRAFHTLYNPVLAVDVLARLRGAYPGATLVMIGADKGDGALGDVERRIAELGVSDAVQIVPGVPKREVPRYLAAGDIFLNTTDADNSPVSVLEAMACGLCVASTAVGGIPYLLEHERDALLVPPRDVAAMTAAVTRFLSEPRLAGRLSAAAREHAVARDWANVLPHWEQIFAQVMTDA